MSLIPSRREFIVGGAAALAGASRLVCAQVPSPVRLGIASYTFRNFKPDQVIDYMHQLKTPYINLKPEAHLPMKPLADVPGEVAKYKAAGLKLTGVGAIYFRTDTDEEIAPIFDYLKATGVPMFVGAPTQENLPRVEKYIKKHNIKMAIHNHGPEDKHFPSPQTVYDAIKNMDHRIGFCVDLGHTMRAGMEPVDALKLAGSRLYDIHMKDLTKKDDKESQVAVGEGLMPIKDIFTQLIAMKYPGIVDLEYEIHGDDPFPGVQKSFAYMRDVLKQMGYTA